MKGVDLDVAAGETVAVVGEVRLGQEPAHDGGDGASGEEREGRGDRRLSPGRNLLALPPAELNTIRGRKITMIFQEPMTSLDPLWPVGNQLAEPLMRHQGLSRKAALQRGGRVAGAGAHPQPRPATEILSARTVGRAAPARDDRHGDRQ